MPDKRHIGFGGTGRRRQGGEVVEGAAVVAEEVATVVRVTKQTFSGTPLKLVATTAERNAHDARALPNFAFAVAEAAARAKQSRVIGTVLSRRSGLGAERLGADLLRPAVDRPEHGPRHHVQPAVAVLAARV